VTVSPAPALAGAPPPRAEPAAAPPEEKRIAARFHRELEAEVRFLALEKPPHAAALGAEEVWIHDARGWRKERLPPSARAAAGSDLALFYGRDDRVRIIGSRLEGGAPRGVYQRLLPTGFRVERSEIGRFAGLTGPLVSVLGTADPEIVCQPDDACLVKRRSGWTTIGSPADLTRVTLGEGVGWAVAGRQLLRLGAGWEPAGTLGTWARADALFATRDRAWVVETGAACVHAFDGATWTAAPSPIAGPRALWGARADALWLAGEGGLAFFDGSSWRRVNEAPAPLAAVLGRGEADVWVGGAKGLHRVERL
jgi:hypothetical protein